MNNNIKHFLVLVFLLSFTLQIKSQDFNYSVTNEQIPFVYLTESTSFNNGELWENKAYKIPIGFNFNFAGGTFDSITVLTNGTITFDSQSQYNIVALYKNFFSEVDSTNNSLSPLSYKLVIEGDGSQTLKVEYKNVVYLLPDNTTRIHSDFQIWLTQSGVIEFHMGNSEAVAENAETYIVGLINMYNPNQAALGYLLSGTSATITGTAIPAGGNLVELTDKPLVGSTYKFIKN